MAAIKFADPATIVWVASADEPEGDVRQALAKLSDKERKGSFAMHHPGTEQDLQLFEVEIPAGGGTEVHAHAEAEIIYVVAGEMKLGARTLCAGASVFIPAGTLYSFSAGESGLRFLNFRPRRDVSYITKDEFMSERRSSHVPRDGQTLASEGSV